MRLGRSCVTIYVAAPGIARLLEIARPSLVNGGKSGRTGEIGDMTTAATIIGPGFAGNTARSS